MKKLEKMCEDRYADEGVRKAILEDADRRGTRKQLESGELALPAESDAIAFAEAEAAQPKAKKAHDE